MARAPSAVRTPAACRKSLHSPAPGGAAALLAGHLPADVAARLDPDIPPEHLEGTFIDDAGIRSQCDALFRVRLRGGGEPGCGLRRRSAEVNR